MSHQCLLVDRLLSVISACQWVDHCQNNNNKQTNEQKTTTDLLTRSFGMLCMMNVA